MCSRVQPCFSQIALTCSNWTPHSSAGPSSSTIERGGHPDRVARVHRLLGGLDRERVHHLDGGGHDARGDDVGHHVARRGDRREVGQQRLHGLGHPHQPHGDLRDDPERALRAEHHAAQVRPGLLAGVAADRHQRAVGQHDLGGQHVVGGEPVLEAVRAAGVLRDVAADRAHLLAGRVGRVVQPVRRRRLRDRQVGDARLDDRPPVDRVDLQDLREARQADHHAVGDRQRAAGEPGARPARDERHLVLVAHPHRRRDLLGVAGEQHQVRDDAVAGEPVALVGAALHRVGDHVRGGQRLLERLPHRAVERHRALLPVGSCLAARRQYDAGNGSGPPQRDPIDEPCHHLRRQQTGTREARVGPRRTLQLLLVLTALATLALALSGVVGPASCLKFRT